MSEAATIYFYRIHDLYGEFSNFYPSPITLKGKEWPTSEHYFQAQKFSGTELEEVVRLAASPAEARRMGHSHALRADWHAIRNEVMHTAVRAKFSQYPKLRRLLDGTGEAALVEHTPKDHYWADGGDGSGANMLGKILMAVRQELRQEQPGHVS